MCIYYITRNKMSVFDLPQQLQSINAGCDRFDISQVYPISGNVTNSFVGSGNASGLSTFQWSDSNLWWSPCNSYFQLQLQFSYGDGTTIAPGDYVAYADNFPSTLFSQIKTQINSRQLDIVDVPYIIDQALTYSNAKQNFLQTFGSLTRVGEGWQTRLNNTCNNSGIVEVIYRPPCSIFDVKLLPPGAQFRVDFNFASNAALAWESLAGDVTIGTSGTSSYNVKILGFSFYKATLSPSQFVDIPKSGIIELSPSIINQYYLNGGSQLKQNITLPSTTNRILVCLQDANRSQGNQGVLINQDTGTIGNTVTRSATAGVGTGFNPATKFALSFSGSNNVAYGVKLTQFYLNLPELGQNFPNPVYSFDNSLDYNRLYSDWSHLVQGTYHQTEGSVPFGNLITDIGCNVIANAGGILNVGNPNNREQANVYNSTATLTPTPKTLTPFTNMSLFSKVFSQSAQWGYLGRVPMIPVPVIRPENKPISVGTLSMTFSGSVASVVANVLCTYSMALQVEDAGNGQYNYNLVEGV